MANTRPVRIMLVDDSAIIRTIYKRMMEADPDIEIVAVASNGQQAIDSLKTVETDLIVLDIEMPVMDGLSAIPHLLAVRPHVTILMSSTLSARNAQVSLRAMQAGAADCIQKPVAHGDISGQQEFRDNLLDKIKTLGALSQTAQTNKGASLSTEQKPALSKSRTPDGITLRKPGKARPEVVAVGSSTGGPRALIHIFGQLPPDLGLPVVVTQHMPPVFTKTLADHIHATTGWVCREAVDREELEPDKILFAPGDYHMTVENKGNTAIARLDQNPPVNFCRPAVDPTFESVASVYGEAVLALVLTGMGNDGVNGGRAIVNKGGTVLVQDEETSIVWGMPGAVAAAGLCSGLVALDDIAGEVTKYVRGTVP